MDVDNFGCFAVFARFVKVSLLLFSSCWGRANDTFFQSSISDETVSQTCTIQLVNMSKCEMLHFLPRIVICCIWYKRPELIF